MKQLPLLVIIVIIAAVAGGFFLIGSPSEERARRFDERRVNDLQIMQSEIINYWRLKNMLPQNLTVLQDDIRGFEPPQDPETNAPYEYAVKNLSSFELCAVFNRGNGESASRASKPMPRESYGQNWEHTAGRICFTRIIDKDLYPPEKFHPATP